MYMYIHVAQGNNSKSKGTCTKPEQLRMTSIHSTECVVTMKLNH